MLDFLVLFVQYDLLVRNIEDAGAASVINTERVFASLSEAISAHAMKNNETFPFVTLPGFELFASYARQLSGIEMLAYTPLVQDHQMADWIKYSMENQGWLEESREMTQRENTAEGLFTTTSYEQDDIPPLIYERNDNGQEVPSKTPPYLPIWQEADHDCCVTETKDAWVSYSYLIDCFVVEDVSPSLSAPIYQRQHDVPAIRTQTLSGRSANSH